MVLAPGGAEAASEHVQFLLPQLKLLDEQVREVGNRIKRLLSAMIETTAGAGQPPCDAGLILSIPGVGPRSCCRSADRSLQADPGARLRVLALLCRHGSGDQAERKEEDRRYASSLQSALAKRGFSTGRQAASVATAEAESITTQCGQRAISTHELYAGWLTGCLASLLLC